MRSIKSAIVPTFLADMQRKASLLQVRVFNKTHTFSFIRYHMLGKEREIKSNTLIKFYNKCINDVYVQCLHGDTENMFACLRRYV